MIPSFLLFILVQLVISAPLTDKEVQNRIVAVSKSKPELLRVAVSQADPDLLRTALTDADPNLLEKALTKADPGLLAAALQDIDPEALITALTTSDGLLLTLALTRSNSKVAAQRSGISSANQEELLQTALTGSDPELLKT